MAYKSVPNTLFPATVPVPASQLDANFTYVSAKWISVKDYGAVGDNATDDTAAIQAAIAAAIAAGQGTVYFPNGLYKVTSTITVAGNYVALVGQSISNSKIIASGDFGDVLYVKPATGQPNANNVRISNLTVITGNDTTSGAALRLEKCNYSTFSDLLLQDRFGGILVDSCIHCYFSNLLVVSGALWSGQKAGSYLVRVNRNAGTSCAELHFSNCDWRGSGNMFLQYAVWLEQVDGIWFTDLHCGFCYGSAFAMLPPSDAAAITAVAATNVYVDTATQYGVYLKENSGTASVSCNALLNGFLCFNCDRAVMLDHHLGTVVINGGYTVNTQHGVYLNQGVDCIIGDLRVTDVNRGATTGYGLYIGTTVKGVMVDGLFVRKESFTATAGIYVDNGAQFVNVASATFRGCATDIIDISPVTPKRYGTICTDQGVPVLTASVGNVLSVPPSGFPLALLNATNAVNSIDLPSSYDGRELTLISNGAVTVNAVNNLHLTANWTPGVSSRCLKIICYSQGWYEVSRT